MWLEPLRCPTVAMKKFRVAATLFLPGIQLTSVLFFGVFMVSPSVSFVTPTYPPLCCDLDPHVLGGGGTLAGTRVMFSL